MTPGTHFLYNLLYKKARILVRLAAEQRLPLAGTEPDRSIFKVMISPS
jgi:hypothetical protein